MYTHSVNTNCFFFPNQSNTEMEALFDALNKENDRLSIARRRHYSAWFVPKHFILHFILGFGTGTRQEEPPGLLNNGDQY